MLPDATGVLREQAGDMPATAFPSPPLVYVECDLADGQTLTEWRRSRAVAPEPRRWLRPLALLATRPPGRRSR